MCHLRMLMSSLIQQRPSTVCWKTRYYLSVKPTSKGLMSPNVTMRCQDVHDFILDYPSMPQMSILMFSAAEWHNSHPTLSIYQLLGCLRSSRHCPLQITQPNPDTNVNANIHICPLRSHHHPWMNGIAQGKVTNKANWRNAGQTFRPVQSSENEIRVAYLFTLPW